MIKHKFWTTFRFFLFLFILPSLIFAQFNFHTIDYYKETADRILESSLGERVGYKWLKELCEIGPRLSGSPESYEAIKWAELKFNEMDCDSIWLQPIIVPHWVRGDTEVAIVRNSKEFEGKKLSIAALGGSIGTVGDGIQGKVMEVHSFEELKLRANEAEGKIIFFNRPFNKTISSTFRAYGDAVEQRTYGAIEAAKYGGVAAIVRSVTSKPDNVPHVGAMKYVDSLINVPSVAIGVKDADWLSKAVKDDPNLEIQLILSCVNLDEIESYNVIGEIRGTEYPNEIIVVGGHFDSWDKGCGAHDDGAPCIQTMEVLDLIKRLDLKPKRTIRCVLFINEENGLRGGLGYGNYADSNESEYHLAAIESDRGALIPRGFTTDADSTTIEYLHDWLPILNKTKIDWIRKGGTGADISRIKTARALFGFVPDDQRYFDFHHSDNDTFESVNAREMQFGTAAITLMAYLLSEEGLK